MKDIRQQFTYYSYFRILISIGLLLVNFWFYFNIFNMIKWLVTLTNVDKTIWSNLLAWYNNLSINNKALT